MLILIEGFWCKSSKFMKKEIKETVGNVKDVL